MVMDMTVGSPVKKILSFFVPVLLGNLLQQLYSMADSIIVSRFIGVDAFAGISATGSLNFLIIGFALGMCSGFAIPVSQEFGAGDRNMMRRCFANGIYVAAIMAILMAILTVTFTTQILQAIGTPEDIFIYSQTYIRIIFMGIPATVFYNLFAGVMRAVGDGKTPLVMLIISCLLNIVLDILFVAVLKVGIAGAAIATILAQLVSCCLCIYVIFKKTDVLKIRQGEWGMDGAIVRRLIGFGLPMGLQFSLTAVGGVILQRAVNSLGSAAVASIGAGARIQFIFTTPLEAVGITMATYCGQNLGARKIDRVHKGVMQVTLLQAAYSAVAFILQKCVGYYIALLFIDSSETEILANVQVYLDTVVLYAFLLAIVLTYRNAIQGLGYSKAAMFAGVFELVGRAFVALVLVKYFGFAGAVYANPIAWISADILLVPMYIYVIRKYKKIYPAEPAAVDTAA